MTTDTQAATAAYIDGLGADTLAKAAAYTTGGHWLLLWALVASAVVTLVIVRWGVLDRVEAKLARRGPNLRAFVVGVVYFLVSAALMLPWSLYEQWWRETSYGRTSQPLGDFLGQGLLSIVISALLGALFFVGVYALIRRTGRAWWAWSAGLTAAALSALLLAAPVVIEPLFNDFKPVPAGEVRDALVVMADRAGVPEDRIFVYDGSRQSNNFTANAGGVGGTARIAISDVAFKGASLDEVKAVTAHEIGHYVLGHTWRTGHRILGSRDPVLLPGRQAVPALRARLRQPGIACRPGRPAGAAVHGIVVRAAGRAGVKWPEPGCREPGRPVLARGREPA